MKIKKIDKENRYISIFDTDTGFYMRTGVIDENGKDTGVDPFMSSMPELIDIGIMRSCPNKINGVCKVDCYQGGSKHINEPNMTFENYKKIIDQIKGRTFQVALGGNGDPNKHPEFEKIIKYSAENNIVPNYTTSGFGLTDKEIELTKKYCGAVAVSEYRCDATRTAIKQFLDNGIKVNIHYVLGKDSIDEAIDKLKNNGFDKGINAVIFLLYKPVGLGKAENVLDVNDPRIKEFYELIDNNKFDFKIGFDSCNSTAITNFTKNINFDSMDACEASRFSMYIDANMIALPCSFDNQDKRYGVDLNIFTIKEAWNSTKFNNFRNYLRHSCVSCKDRGTCLGGCPLVNQITLCNRKERDFKNV